MSDVAPEAPQADPTEDPLRQQLLDAATHVFAEQGYAGTKVADIVRASGLSSGAMYGRFRSKNELMMEAVVSAALRATTALASDQDVGEFIAEFASRRHGPLSDLEAVQLEAYVTARREPEVAAAIAAGRQQRRDAIAPLVEQASAGGLVDEDSDIESILYFFDTMNLGLLLQRAAGIGPPDSERWEEFVRKVLARLAGDPGLLDRDA